MASIAAKEVAKEVLETIGRGKIPNMGKIARKKGYSDNTADNPQQIVSSKSYQEVIAPVVQQLEKERQRAIKAMKGKISEAKYRDLVDSVDKLTKNVQLLTGGKTGNDSINISWES